VVLLILWMALHSAKIISAVFVNLFIGLSITTAVGLMMVGSLNLLSIAFAVLFVGLGVDFGIQYSVRYRSERFKSDDLPAALEQAAERSAVPLSLAAMGLAQPSADQLGIIADLTLAAPHMQNFERPVGRDEFIGAMRRLEEDYAEIA